MRQAKHIVMILLALASLTGSAAGSSSGGNEEPNDRRRKYDAENDESAAHQGDKKSKEQLTPPMMQHLQKAQQHRQQAQQARQNKDEGTAQKEEMMANMEQMKGQQLKQQIDENQKSADKNRESAKLLRNQDDDNGQKGINKGIQSVTVDKDRQAAKEAAAAEKLPGPSMEPGQPGQPPASEIAKFDDFQTQRQALNELIAKPAPAPPPPPPVVKAEEPKAKPWEAELDQLGKNNRIGIGFADNASSTSAAAQVRTGFGLEASAGFQPQARLLNAASDTPGAAGSTSPDVFSKPAGDATLADTLGAGDGKAGKSGEGDVPKLLASRKTKKDKDKDGEGDDFWKSTDPKKKKLRIAGSTRARHVKAKGVVSVRKASAGD